LNNKQKKEHNKLSKKLQKKFWEEIKMDNKQKINCTVESCKYNNQNKKICELNAIMVTPKQNVNSENPDESECSSYECK
jgi:P pilus assembly chaperone PapD